MMRWPVATIFCRSFFIQACWNYPRMQGIGFLHSLLPAAQRLFPNRTQRIEFLKRQSGFFNAQPYCASLALGSILRQEADLRHAENQPAVDRYQQMELVKNDLCGMLGLLGDQLFWQRLKPISAALGMMGAMALGGSSPAAGLCGAILLLLLFNPLHLGMRWWGLQTGLRAGAGISEALARSPWPRWNRGLSTLGFLVTLIFTVIALTFTRREMGWGPLLAFGLCFLFTEFALQRRISIYYTLLAVALLCLVPVLLRMV